MMDLLELTYPTFFGGQTVPAGTYINFRTMAYKQYTSDTATPLVGKWIQVDPSGTQSLSTVATNLNALLGTSYTSGSFHAEGSPDLAHEPGTGSDDA